MKNRITSVPLSKGIFWQENVKGGSYYTPSNRGRHEQLNEKHPPIERLSIP